MPLPYILVLVSFLPRGLSTGEAGGGETGHRHPILWGLRGCLPVCFEIESVYTELTVFALTV